MGDVRVVGGGESGFLTTKLDALNDEINKLVNAVPEAEREKNFPEIYASTKDVRAAIRK